MSPPDAVQDRELERQGRRMIRPALRFLVIAVVVAIPGIVLIVLDHGWSVGVGIALLLIASIPAVVAGALLVSGSVARWAARHRLFA